MLRIYYKEKREIFLKKVIDLIAKISIILYNIRMYAYHCIRYVGKKKTTTLKV